jgi:hypothetical protein
LLSCQKHEQLQEAEENDKEPIASENPDVNPKPFLPCDMGPASECEIDKIGPDEDPPIQCSGPKCNCAVCHPASAPPTPEIRQGELVDKLVQHINNDNVPKFFKDEDWEEMFPRLIKHPSVLDSLRTGDFTMIHFTRKPTYYFAIVKGQVSKQNVSVGDAVWAVDFEKK